MGRPHLFGADDLVVKLDHHATTEEHDVRQLGKWCTTPLPPPAISGGAGLEHPCGSVTPLIKSVTVRTRGRAVSMENSRLREAAPTSVNVTVGQRGRDYLTDREIERLIEAAKQNRSTRRCP